MNTQTEQIKKPSKKLRQVTVIQGNGYPMLSRKILPNDLCPCGSGKKAKKCCGTDTKYYYSKTDPKPMDMDKDMKARDKAMKNN